MVTFTKNQWRSQRAGKTLYEEIVVHNDRSRDVNDSKYRLVCMSCICVQYAARV